ncbi:MAG TPA: deoxyribonuclease IV [Oculatellaceae cyanobacterium]
MNTKNGNRKANSSKLEQSKRSDASKIVEPRSLKKKTDAEIELNQFDTEVMIGAHAIGGIKGAVAKAEEIGAHTVQIFMGSPQMWKHPSPRLEELESFKSDSKQRLPGPVFVHGNYLVNLASYSLENRRRSIGHLHHALRLADSANAQGLIFHPGSAGTRTYREAIGGVIEALEAVLDGYKGRCRLLLEVCAGQGQTIGDEFSEFRDILSGLGFDDRLGVCWDTCHLFNAGYDIASDDGLKRTMEEFEREVGFNWLFAVHANDSKHPLGARKDRHENIGEGYIGREAFQRMLHQPVLRTMPWILEVPGFENKGPDKQNIDLMRQLAFMRK